MSSKRSLAVSLPTWHFMAPCKNCHLNYGEHVGYKCLFQETTYEPAIAY
jgi:hypothetical protein